LGVCAGTAVLDCHDVCNGMFQFDACGECGGSDVTFCPKVNISVETGSNPFNSDHHLLAEYDATHPLLAVTNLITVSNTNDVILNVSFLLADNEENYLPPSLSLPTDDYQLQPYSNMSFQIVSNISDLTNRYNSWAIKKFQIK